MKIINFEPDDNTSQKDISSFATQEIENKTKNCLGALDLNLNDLYIGANKCVVGKIVDVDEYGRIADHPSAPLTYVANFSYMEDTFFVFGEKLQLYNGDCVKVSGEIMSADGRPYIFVSEEFGKKILFEAVNLKIKYNAPMQAADIYNSYLEPSPISCSASVHPLMTPFSGKIVVWPL